MIDHMGITVRDLAKSKAFYSIALGALGYVPFTTDPDAIGYGIREGHGKTTNPGGEFWLSEGAPMTPPSTSLSTPHRRPMSTRSMPPVWPPAEPTTARPDFAPAITRTTMRRSCLIPMVTMSRWFAT
jgi:catechol 2,3-dioxygenase-like lactoylglutathione lyase family enzyme